MSKARELANTFTKSEIEAYTNGLALGVNQTWVDVTDNREIDVTYTNTTGRPIQVSVVIGVSSDKYAYLIGLIDGQRIARNSSVRGDGFSDPSGIVFTVPSGSTYKFIVETDTTYSVYVWSELR